MHIKRVMIIDDNEVDRFLHEAVIHSTYPEIEVLQAFDGLHALEILQNSKPDLIFLDINMPKMNGLAFLAALEKTHDIPAVYMLASSYQESDKAQIAKYEMVKTCLEKPLTPEMLVDIMKT